MISLARAAGASGRFFIFRKDIAEKYHVSNDFISDAIRELKSQNLLDVKYGAIDPESHKHEHASAYTPLTLYDPEVLRENLGKLETKVGAEKLERAIRTASVVFKQNDIATLEDLIELENRYGQAVVQEAAQKISVKSTDNPKRSAGYLINTIKSFQDPPGKKSLRRKF